MNDFSNKKLLSDTSKTVFVKLEAKHFLNPLITATPPVELNIHTCTFPRENLSKITATYTSNTEKNPREIITFTEVESNPSEHQYTYNKETKELVMVGKIGTTYYYTAHYQLFFASNQDQVTGINPLNPHVDLVRWKGLVTEMPTVSQDLSDSIVGTYSLTSSSITLINDGEFVNHLGPYDSFCKSVINIYLAIDGLENVKSIFVGSVSDIVVTDEEVTLNLKDFIQALDKTAIFGDTETELFKNEIPIPLVFGNASRYAEKGNVYGKIINRFFTNHGYDLDHEILNTGICDPLSSTISVTTNREFICCRVKGVADISTTLSNKSTDIYGNVSYNATNVDKLTIGDTLNNVANDRFIRITRINTVTNLIHIKTGEFAADPVNGTVFQTNSMPTVVISGGETALPVIYLAYGKHYTTKEVDTSGGNKLISIVLNNNFEADASFADFFGGTKILDPGKHKVHYKVRPDNSDHKHGTVLKSLLTHAGLEVDEASFTYANNLLSTNIQFQIPYYDESEYNTFRFYVSEILVSTCSILRANDLGKIEYKLLDATNDLATTRADNDIALQSFNLSIDYNDIIYGLTATNKHNFSVDSYNKATDYHRNEQTRSLHDIDTIELFEHVLETVNTNTMLLIYFYRTNRRGIYKFNTLNIDLDTLIYDRLKIEKDNLLENKSNTDVRIVGISKSVTDVEIEAIDIIGEPYNG